MLPRRRIYLGAYINHLTPLESCYYLLYKLPNKPMAKSLPIDTSLLIVKPKVKLPKNQV